MQVCSDCFFSIISCDFEILTGMYVGTESLRKIAFGMLSVSST
jgi:hypothetical protein